jgi:ketosteroid isomerase-like protein
MSEENVEIVLRQFELWSAGDLDGWAECYDPAVVVTAPEGWPEGSASRGLDAWRLQAERLRDTWDEARVEVDEIRTVDDGRVVTRIRYITVGKEPGISFDTSMGTVFFLRDGKIIRAEYFWDFDDALEAARRADPGS